MNKKKTVKLSVRIKNCDKVFDDSMGPGVIATREIEFSASKKEFKSAAFAVQLMRIGDEIIEEIITVDAQEIT